MEIATLTTFRMNSRKSVSKQRTLTTFIIRTYAKAGGGGNGRASCSQRRPGACDFENGVLFAGASGTADCSGPRAAEWRRTTESRGAGTAWAGQNRNRRSGDSRGGESVLDAEQA